MSLNRQDGPQQEDLKEQQKSPLQGIPLPASAIKVCLRSSSIGECPIANRLWLSSLGIYPRTPYHPKTNKE